MADSNKRSTPYDDIFKTLIAKGGSMVIPLVNAIFNQKIPESSQIDNMADEQYSPC